MIQKIWETIKNGTLSYKLYRFINRHRHLFFLSDETVRSVQYSSMVFHKLKKKYAYVLDRKIEERERQYDSTIWVCWFQGIENAPFLCQVCVKRMKKVFGEENVVVISKENFADYVDIPDYIVQKWNDGIISNAQFSDILRIALLSENGGTWIDATILILEDELPEYLYKGELFVFADHISGIYPNIQSSYMSAWSNSRLLICARELMYEYWKKENYLLDYSLFHLFFQMAEERYPDEWEKVYKYPNHSTHILRKNIFDPFDPSRYEQIKDVCPIQKLTYKKTIPDQIEGTFYKRLIVDHEEFFGR